MTTTNHTAPTAKVPDHEAILRDAQEHPERTPSEHVEAARTIAAKSYREEIRAMMKAGLMDDGEDIGQVH